MDDKGVIKKFFESLATDIVDNLVNEGLVNISNHTDAVGNVILTLESQTEKIKNKTLTKP